MQNSSRTVSPEITLLHSITPLPYEFGALEGGGAMLSEIYSDRAQQVEAELNRFLIDELAGCKVKRVILEGDPAQRIVEYAHAENVNLIVMPTHGYGTFRPLHPGIEHGQADYAECPVWTGVHLQDAPQHPVTIRSILCAIDSDRRPARRSPGRRPCSVNSAPA